MNQPTLLIGQVYAVLIPECMNAFKVECRPEIDLYELSCYQIGEYDEPISEDSIDLPAGDWEYLGTTEEVAEEIAAQIVARDTGGFTGRATGYKDYVLTGLDMQPLSKAVESLRTLLTSKGLDQNKNYVLIKKL